MAAAAWDDAGRASNLLQLLGVDAFGLVSMITQAALTARQNRDLCLQLANHGRVVAGLLHKLQRVVPQLRRHPETRRPLEQLDDALRRAYLLVRTCGRELEVRGYLYQLLTGARTAARLRAADEEIDRYIRLIPMIALLATVRVEVPDQVDLDSEDSTPPASTSFSLQRVAGSTHTHEQAPTGDIVLPGIEGFHIVGEPKLGFKLAACGFPTIGATIHDYEITPDDVGTFLAVECTPMDDNGCKGEFVREFANEENKIACDRDMQTEIEAHVSTGSVIFNVFIMRDSWTPATMLLRRTSYEIKIRHIDEVIVKEKYSPNLQIKLLHRRSTQFEIVSSGGDHSRLSFETRETTGSRDGDAIRLRNLIVMVMRTFQKKALTVTVDAEGSSRPSRGVRLLLSKSKE